LSVEGYLGFNECVLVGSCNLEEDSVESVANGFSNTFASSNATSFELFVGSSWKLVFWFCSSTLGRTVSRTGVAGVDVNDVEGVGASTSIVVDASYDGGGGWWFWAGAAECCWDAFVEVPP
jgi:hypothetical protein